MKRDRFEEEEEEENRFSFSEKPLLFCKLTVTQFLFLDLKIEAEQLFQRSNKQTSCHRSFQL